MSSVIHRTTLDYLTSVNTPEYPETDWIINPDVSAVTDVPRKYWKLDGDRVIEMTQSEKDAVDAQELQNRIDAVKELGDAGLKDVMTALIKIINLRLSSGQKITKDEFIQAIKDEIK